MTPLDMPARQAQLPAAGRELHRRILRTFLDAGRPPEPDELRAMAGELRLDLDIALRGLASIDLVHVDDDGRVAVAYPFSGRPTGMLVQLRDGPEVQAMCAVDALGIPPMSGRDAVITADDPHTGEQVRVESADGRWTWHPEHAVVLVADDGSDAILADSTCPMITFHVTEDSASSHLADRGDTDSRILTQEQALDLAEKLFGPLLRD